MSDRIKSASGNRPEVLDKETLDLFIARIAGVRKILARKLGRQTVSTSDAIRYDIQQHLIAHGTDPLEAAKTARKELPRLQRIYTRAKNQQK